MYTTRTDQQRQWQRLLGAVGLLFVLWGVSLIPKVVAATQTTPDVGDAIVVFAETYELTDKERQDLTRVVADWLTRNPSLADQPLRVYQLMKQQQNVP